MGPFVNPLLEKRDLIRISHIFFGKIFCYFLWERKSLGRFVNSREKVPKRGTSQRGIKLLRYRFSLLSAHTAQE